MSNSRKSVNFPYIYEPSDDSFLILNFMDENKTLFKDKSVLDMGTGSGILSVKAADLGSDVTAVDINEYVIEELKEKHLRKSIHFKVSNLFSHIRGKFDIVLFNPPYLPRLTTEDEAVALAVSGGKHGYEIIVSFLSKLNLHLKNDGFALLVFSSLTNKEMVDETLVKYGFEYVLIKKQDFDFETLFLYKIEKMEFLKYKGLKHAILFAKGKRGLVYKAELLIGKKKIQVAVKVLRSDTGAVGVIENEAKWLSFMNTYSIGPRFIFKGTNFVIMQFINGKEILFYFEIQNKKNPERVIVVVNKIIKQCILLDLLRVNKEELHRPLKHIIIAKTQPVMIDFERTHRTNKPKNISQLLQFLSSGRVKTALTNLSIDVQCLRKLSKQYKNKLNDLLEKTNEKNLTKKDILKNQETLFKFLNLPLRKCLEVIK